MRTCVGCGARDLQTSLIRLTAVDQDLRIDRMGHGRGAYLHRDRVCWDGFLRKKSLFRALRTEISRSARQKLLQQLGELNRE